MSLQPSSRHDGPRLSGGIGMRRGNLITGIIWLVLAILILAEAIHLDLGTLHYPGPGFFPFLTAIPLAFLAFLLIWETTAGKARTDKGNQAVWAADTDWRKILLSLAALIIYALLLERVGYVFGTFLLMLFLFKSLEAQKWRVAIFASVAAVLLSYFIFDVWLQCQFPQGIFGRMIQR